MKTGTKVVLWLLLRRHYGKIIKMISMIRFLNWNVWYIYMFNTCSVGFGRDSNLIFAEGIRVHHCSLASSLMDASSRTLSESRRATSSSNWDQQSPHWGCSSDWNVDVDIWSTAKVSPVCLPKKSTMHNTFVTAGWLCRKKKFATFCKNMRSHLIALFGTVPCFF